MPILHRKSLLTLGGLTALAIVLRFFSFFPSVIDHDESTYIIIADALLQGKVYFRDVVDTKPIGIFGLFALFQVLFGKSIMVIRVITAVWIALTAWMIYLVHGKLAGHHPDGPPNSAPLASAIIYVIMTSVFTFFGVSPNTEIFFTFFTIIALYLVISRQEFGWMFVAGVLLGLGFLIKYVVLFDALALGLFYLWSQVIAGKKWTYWFSRCCLMAAGFIIPFGLLWIYYAEKGMTETFLFFTFKLSGRYFIDSSWDTNLIFILDCLARYFPVTFWFFYCTWHWRTTGRDLPVLAWLWGILVIIIMLIPGKLFYHYFIQFMLPMSLLAGSFFDSRRSPGRAVSWMRKPVFGYPILVTGMLVNMYFQKIDFFDKNDYPREVAAWLNARLQPDDIIYTGNYHQILYLLTGTNSPTPYIHSSLLWDAENNRALGIDRAAECNKILAHKPRFIFFGKKMPVDNPMIPVLEAEYKQILLFETKLYLYERR